MENIGAPVGVMGTGSTKENKEEGCLIITLRTRGQRTQGQFVSSTTLSLQQEWSPTINCECTF